MLQLFAAGLHHTSKAHAAPITTVSTHPINLSNSNYWLNWHFKATSDGGVNEHNELTCPVK